MKIGQKVFVCYDGKYGRRTIGTIIEKRKGSHIKVRFQEYAGESIIEAWFPKRQRQKKYGGKPYYFGKFVKVENSLMDMLFGSGGDWYSVFEYKD